VVDEKSKMAPSSEEVIPLENISALHWKLYGYHQDVYTESV